MNNITKRDINSYYKAIKAYVGRRLEIAKKFLNSNRFFDDIIVEQEITDAKGQIKMLENRLVDTPYWPEYRSKILSLWGKIAPLEKRVELKYEKMWEGQA